jgi:tetratricopeptide (TPR) repeat protein
MALEIVMAVLLVSSQLDEKTRQARSAAWQTCVNAQAGSANFAGVDLERAIGACDLLLAPDVAMPAPTRAVVMGSRGVLRGRKGLIKQALEDINAALPNLEPADKTAFLIERGLVLSQDAQYPAAIADFNAVIAQSAPGSNEVKRAVQGRGIVYFLVKDYPRALPDLNAVDGFNPNNAFVLYMRGESKRMTGDAEGARADRARALGIDAQIETRFQSFLKGGR